MRGPDQPAAPPVVLGGTAGHAPASNGNGGQHSLRRDLVFALRRGGPATPEELARRVGASRTGVLQQLRALESAGFVAHRTVRHGVGRPRHVFDLTPAAQPLFPDNYGGLALDLLGAIDRVGGSGLVSEVLAARRSQLADRVRARVAERAGPGAPLADRVRELAVIQDELGYLADVTLEPDGTLRLREHNCAIYDVACGHPEACSSELDLFRQVLGADVVRESHIAAGDRCCSYRIGPPS